MNSKKEYLANSTCLKKELGDNIDKLNSINLQRQLDLGPFAEIFSGYATLDAADKKHLAKLLPPTNVNFQTGELSLELNGTLSKILMLNKNGQL